MMEEDEACLQEYLNRMPAQAMKALNGRIERELREQYRIGYEAGYRDGLEKKGDEK